MIISTPNLSDAKEDFVLTPAMIRGAFMLWRSELQRGQQLTEIRELDGHATVNHVSTRASANSPIVDGNQAG